MTSTLQEEQQTSIKKSYFNILALFLEQEKIESRFLRCLLKWGFQLNLNPDDLSQAAVDVHNLAFSQPAEKIENLEAIYHLVYMIYLDKVVEDVELEVATIYSVKLGFKPDVVSELFKSIATAVYDETTAMDVRQEVLDFLQVHDS